MYQALSRFPVLAGPGIEAIASHILNRGVLSVVPWLLQAQLFSTEWGLERGYKKSFSVQSRDYVCMLLYKSTAASALRKILGVGERQI